MDLRARRLERRFKQSGDRTAWVRWLRDRLRRGELEPSAAALIEGIAAGAVGPEEVALAAYLGDPLALAVDEHQAVALATYLQGAGAARLVVGDPAPTPQELAGWLAGLAHFGAEAVVRALIACGDWVLAEFRRAPPPRDPHAYDYAWDWTAAVAETAQSALAVARDWARCPCERHARAAGKVPGLLDPYSPYFVVLVAEQAVRAAALAGRHPEWPDAFDPCLAEVARGIEEGLAGAPRPAEVVEAIREGLVPELLYGVEPLEG